ncbi:MAG: metal ABC transporter permease [Candidatus Methanomethylophilaceae archaeon]|nr:metal ABC transporter permease [Candidatus Methanomethylophilaceae archaeon]MDY0224512.1 metal ABC transporter permease [Candidatus Methanomethylophilaceae archaeon]
MTNWSTVFSISLIQNMFMATIIACVLCGVIGTYVVINRSVSATGGIAHTTFGGVGFAYYMESVFFVSWFTPMMGALLFGIIAALIIALSNVSNTIRQDSMIGALWAVGMALGVIFLCFTNRSVVTPHSYESILFGNVMFVSSNTLITMGILAIIIVAIVIYLYRDLQILTFDSIHARLSGIDVTLLNIVLYVMIAVACVMVSNVVGIVMIIALMTIPAAMANLYTHNLKEMMIFGTILSIVLSILGLLMAIALDCPPGATVVLVIGVAFTIVMLGRKFHRTHVTSRNEEISE